MKRVIFTVIICVAVLLVLFGTVFSFDTVKDRVEEIKDKSDNLMYDITSISLYAFACSDFFGGADSFNFQRVYYADGSVSLLYESYDRIMYEDGTSSLSLMRRENFPIFPIGSYPLAQEVDQAYLRLREPILCFVNWERVPYDGAFSVVLGAVQFVGYILGMIWGAICVIILMIVDTIGTAWQLIGVGYAFLGFY